MQQTLFDTEPEAAPPPIAETWPEVKRVALGLLVGADSEMPHDDVPVKLWPSWVGYAMDDAKPAEITAAINELINEGHAEQRGECIVITEQGMEALGLKP